MNADNVGFFIPDDLRWWKDSIQYLADHRDQVQGFAYWAVDGLKFHHWVNETSGELHQVCMPGLTPTEPVNRRPLFDLYQVALESSSPR